MRSWFIRALAVAGVVAAPGCTVFEDIDAALSRDRSAASVPDVRPGTGDSGPAVRADVRERARPVAGVPLPGRKPEIVDPEALVGLDKTAIAAMFGEPHRVTKAEPATVWAWEMDGCRMRLFFYPDVPARTQRALTYEISADSGKFKALLVDICASRIKWAHAEASR